MSYKFSNISVLIAEDNQPMMEIIKALLGTFGVHKIITATDGASAFKQFCEHRTDLIIADWMMKPVDGIEMTRTIRNDIICPNPYVPIILMTAFGDKTRVVEARDAGVTEFLAKPFNAEDLYKRLTQVIERPRQFVKTSDFCGPDRRRLQSNPNYFGPFRRTEDENNKDGEV